MASVATFEQQLGMMLGLRQRLLQDVSDSEATWQAKPELPSIAWHVAHTMVAEAVTFLGCAKGDWAATEKPWGGLVKMGVKFPVDLKGLPKLSQLTAERAQQHAAVVAFLKSLSDAARAAPFKHAREGALPPILRTVDDGIALLPLHDAHHNGEISLLRRLSGKPGVI